MGEKVVLNLIAVLLSFFIFSFGAMAETGVNSTEIHIGSFGPMTGPAAMKNEYYGENFFRCNMLEK